MLWPCRSLPVVRFGRRSHIRPFLIIFRLFSRWECLTSSVRCRTSKARKPRATATALFHHSWPMELARSWRRCSAGLPYDHLYWSSWLEATRRAVRLFGIEWVVHCFSLPDWDHSIRARIDSTRSRNWDSSLHWNYHRRAVVSGNAERTCSSGSVGDRSSVGSLGSVD